MGHKVHMMTVKARASAAADTAAAFKAVGVPITHTELQVEEPSLRMNGVNYIRALQAARGADVLVIEDDLMPSKVLAPWLDWIAAQQFTVPVFLYVCRSHWIGNDAARKAFDDSAPVKPGVVPVANLNTWWGSQAVWWPAAFTAPFLIQDRVRWLAYELSAMDVELRNYCLQQGVTPLVTVPNLVQHLDYPRITGGGSTHKTQLFTDDVLPPTAEKPSAKLADEVLDPPKLRAKTKEK
jgi:hypothetical protein